MQRSKSGLLESFLEDENSIAEEDLNLLIQTLEKNGNIVIDQRNDLKHTIKENSEQLKNIIIEENIQYYQYIKDITIY